MTKKEYDKLSSEDKLKLGREHFLNIYNESSDEEILDVINKLEQNDSNFPKKYRENFINNTMDDDLKVWLGIHAVLRKR